MGAVFDLNSQKMLISGDKESLLGLEVLLELTLRPRLAGGSGAGGSVQEGGFGGVISAFSHGRESALSWSVVAALECEAASLAAS